MSTAILVASAGGHLSELVRIQRRLADYDDFVWVVPDTGQARSLLGTNPHAGRIEAIPDLKSRDLLGAFGLLGKAWSLMRAEKPDVVLSTGAAPAVPFLVAAALARVPAFYVESLARLDGPSLSAKLLKPVPGVALRTQHESLAWDGWGSIGLGVTYTTSKRPAPTRPMRAVVTVGTTHFDFRALLSRLVTIFPTNADVTWQVGYSDVADLDLPGATQLVPPDEMAELMKHADVVVAHAGVGSALDALEAGCMPILVPRRAERGEHVDDHQVQAAQWLQSLGLAIAPELDELGPSHLELAMTTAVQASSPPTPLHLLG
ncbi:MAG: glycosyltransferase [Acidimicrobiales bacterium]